MQSEDKEKAEYGPLTQQLFAVSCVTTACVTRTSASLSIHRHFWRTHWAARGQDPLLVR